MGSMGCIYVFVHICVCNNNNLIIKEKDAMDLRDGKGCIRKAGVRKWKG